MVGRENIDNFDNILLTVLRSDWSANVSDDLKSEIFSLFGHLFPIGSCQEYFKLKF